MCRRPQGALARRAFLLILIAASVVRPSSLPLDLLRAQRGAAELGARPELVDRDLLAVDHELELRVDGDLDRTPPVVTDEDDVAGAREDLAALDDQRAGREI